MTNDQGRSAPTVGRLVRAAFEAPVLRVVAAVGLVAYALVAVVVNERKQRGPRAAWLAECQVPGVAPRENTESALSYRIADLIDRPAVAAALASLPVRGPGFRAAETGGVAVRNAVPAVANSIEVEVEVEHAELRQDGTPVEGSEPRWLFGLNEEDLSGYGLELDGLDGAGQVTSLLNREPGMVVATEVDRGSYELILDRALPADEVLAMLLRAIGTSYRAAAHERGIVTAELDRAEGAAALDRVRAASEAMAPLPSEQTLALRTQVEERLAAAGFRPGRPAARHRTCGELLHTVSVDLSREGNRPPEAEVCLAVHDRSALGKDQVQQTLDGDHRPLPLVQRTWTVAATPRAVLAVLSDTALPSAEALATRAAVIAHWEHNPSHYSWMDAVQHVDTAARWRLPADATRLLRHAVRKYGRFDEARTACEEVAHRHGLHL